MLNVLSFGAGVQSTTLLLMSCDGVLPKLDAAIFADTQAEPKAVYDHLEWCKWKAASAGVPVLVSTAGNLRQDLIDKFHKGTRAAALPLYVRREDGRVGALPRQCTQEYKIRVVDEVVRNLLGLRPRSPWPVPKVRISALDIKRKFRVSLSRLNEAAWKHPNFTIEREPFAPLVRMWIGISTDESQRRRKSKRPAIDLWYPLLDELTKREPGRLFDRGYTRDDCLEWLSSHGYRLPPRSACTFCPFRSDAEWLEMSRTSPEDFADAVEVDRLIRSGRGEHGLRGESYLHSSLIPLELVQFDASKDTSEGRGMANECQGMCGV